MNATIHFKLAMICGMAFSPMASWSDDASTGDVGQAKDGTSTNTPPAASTKPGLKLDDPVPAVAPKPAKEMTAIEEDAPPVPTDLEPVLDRPAGRARDWDISISYDKILGPDAFWDSAQGFSVDGSYWPWDRWGVGAMMAVTDWEAAGGEVDLPFALHHQMFADGSARTFMVGIGGGYRHPLGQGFLILARAGLAYLTTDSSIRLSTAYRDHFGNDVAYSLYTGNVSRWAGRAGVALRYERDAGRAGVFAQAGIDIQQSLDGDDFGWLRETMGANFDAAVLRLGLGAGF